MCKVILFFSKWTESSNINRGHPHRQQFRQTPSELARPLLHPRRSLQAPNFSCFYMFNGRKRRKALMNTANNLQEYQSSQHPPLYSSKRTTVYGFSGPRHVPYPVVGSAVLCVLTRRRLSTSTFAPWWLPAKSKLSTRLLMEHFRRRTTSKSALRRPVRVTNKLSTPEYGAKSLGGRMIYELTRH